MEASTLDLGRDTTSKTGLRPPTRYNIHAAGLAELSASDNNSRQTSMPPPLSIPIPAAYKHRSTSSITGQPPAKQRKTSAETAGEVKNQFTQSTSIRNVNAPNKSAIPARSTLSVSTNRTGPSYPPQSSKNGTYRKGLQRSQSALGQNANSKVPAIPRPGTSHESRQLPSISQADESTAAKASGTEHISYLSSNLTRRKTRKRVISEQSIASLRASSSCSGTTLAPSIKGISRSNSVAIVSHKDSRVSSLSALNSAFSKVTLQDQPELEEDQSLSYCETSGAAQPKTPRPPQSSQIPVSTPKRNLETSSVIRFQIPSLKPRANSSPQKSPCRPLFMSKDTNLLAPIEWNVGERLEKMQTFFETMKSQMEGTNFESKGMKDIIEMLKTRVAELDAERNRLTMQIDNFRDQLSAANEQTRKASLAAEQDRRNHEIEVDELERKHRYELEDLDSKHKRAIHELERNAASAQDTIRRETLDEIDQMIRSHNELLEEVKSRLTGELEQEKAERKREVDEITAQRDAQLTASAMDIGQKEREATLVREELDRKAAEIQRERTLRQNIEDKLSEVSANTITLEAANSALKAKMDFLASDNEAQSQAFADLRTKMLQAQQAAELANEKLRAEETLRRKLHNQVQELKGNIRVFCRVRPVIEEEDKKPAVINFPDQEDESKEIVVKGEEKRSAVGNVTATNHAFSFDRVFDPTANNSDIFDEISQLVQSALDGYNVCIFCYGQTGSGKTHTMSSPDGMIPRAVTQIYESAKNLEEKGWSYKMVGSFVEVYNENINDLLGKAEDLDKKKHTIQHEGNKTTITDTETVELDSADRVYEVLKRADGNRTVAATKANSRSSRSHSVFILSLVGVNGQTGEKSEGTLNLVDLAGSERLAHSQAEGDRLKETQNINKSLSCLGDVIAALGKGNKAHIPYRNSKLTYLLQNSLGGNSKTLMFVMVSPMQDHLSETLTSLKFATQVHNTHIGTAKQKKSH
ncbi:putative phospholipid-transporting ATPase [Venturia nashicola]|uniref:Kinesin-like protein n=1 Tax=Venturia nashicola TaxID=86259 RepID=A0A4Z1P494_9PEZI|nr:putative phospholipid-transporting ATPase [Venturia nashicola]TLD21005.1 putative phospholipid-transporting ATPase [Venturia nashicola]